MLNQSSKRRARQALRSHRVLDGVLRVLGGVLRVGVEWGESPQAPKQLEAGAPEKVRRGDSTNVHHRQHGKFGGQRVLMLWFSLVFRKLSLKVPLMIP